MSSNFRQIRPLTTELAALERLKHQCLHFFSVGIDPILFKVGGYIDMHNILHEFEFWPNGTTDYGVSCPWASKKLMSPRCPHCQTWISLKQVGQSWSNFMCSITGVGERLHKVLGQIGSKLWFPWQQKAPIDFKWGKRCLHLFSIVFDPILFILAGNEDMHKISDQFEFRPDRTTDYGVSCPWVSKKFPIDL